MTAPLQPAPYVPFRTFLGAVEAFERGLPNQLDRSLWPSYSGAIRGQLLAAFRFLGLMDETQSPTAALREMASRPEARRGLLHSAIERNYRPLVALELSRATPHQLEEAVRSCYGLSGATHKKAVSFFLQAAQFAGFPLSALLKAKTRTAAFGHHRPAAQPERRAKSEPRPVESGSPTAKTIRLKSGGTVSVSAAIDLFTISAEDREFVFELIDRLRAYER